LSAIYATIWFETNSSFFLRFIEVTDGDEGSTALYFFERYGNWILLFTYISNRFII